MGVLFGLDIMNMKNRKGQVGIEFMMLVLFILIVFAIFYLDISSKQIEFREYKMSREAEYIADSIAYQFNIAFAESDGFSMNFTLPNSIVDADYNISIEDRIIYVIWNDKFVFSEVILDDITGVPAVGKNQVSNIGGVLYVTQV